MQFFFPRRHRHYKLTLYLMVAELPFTILMLTLTGIASHDLYRTLLWQDGANKGFNSAPDEMLYAAANYRPYEPPMVWSSFLTRYNLVISVLSVFLLIVKFPVHCMHLLYPPFATLAHGAVFVLYIVSARFQGGSDMSDPKQPQPGPPWYITKSCSAAAPSAHIGYCQQAKALFAITIITLLLYFVEFCVTVHSCFITKEERAAILEEREERAIEKEFEEEIMKSPGMIPMTSGFQAPGMIPRTPGFPPTAAAGPVKNGAIVSSYTPRTLGFNRLGGGNGSTSSDLPLRENASMPSRQAPSQQHNAESQTASGSPMYFPPPPKKADKN